MHARLLNLLLLLLLLAGVSELPAQLSPPGAGSSVDLDLALQRLAEDRRVLLIGAHPDDENTDLLTYMVRAHGARTAYLSLTRGEGGQNLIGQELGDELGLLRSQELVSARSIDGGEQFFTRAYEFGFSSSIEETLGFWNQDSLLKDVVRVVRRFKPDVIVSVWTGTPRDGHGHHQASGVMARRAFRAAADPDLFPELDLEDGIQAWRTAKLYQSLWFRTEEPGLLLPTGKIDPRTGRSFHQVAMASRSQHRSQDMGRLQPSGPSTTKLSLIETQLPGYDISTDSEVFGGIPGVSDGLAAAAVEARQSLRPGDLTPVVRRFIQLRESLSAFQRDSYRRRLVDQVMSISSGIVIDAFSDRSKVVVGEATEITLSVYNGGEFEVDLEGIEFVPGASWRMVWSEAPAGRLIPGEVKVVKVTAVADPGIPSTQPYFLANGRNGFRYSWEGVSPETRGRPFGPPMLTAVARVNVLGVGFEVSREVAHRYNDQAFGEIRDPLRIVPRLGVSLDPPSMVWPLDAETSRPINVALVNNSEDDLVGELEVHVRDWDVVLRREFALSVDEGSRVIRFDLARPRSVGSGTVEVRVVARVGDAEYESGVRLIDYPHIRPVAREILSRMEISIGEIKLPVLEKVGYVRGAADRVPEALELIGVPVVLLGPEDLENGDLSQYDVIVVGSRAYEIDQSLTRFNNRLLDYVEAGGRLLVQYQQYAFVRGEYAPFLLNIARPHDRVTDETSEVTHLIPDHSLFSSPNNIEEADWEGWPQDRGLYFAHEWDDAYLPLIRTSDPGKPGLDGGLLTARYGQGTYTYTGLAFFRSLPAGAMGAYRLFLNLLALDANSTP